MTAADMQIGSVWRADVPSDEGRWSAGADAADVVSSVERRTWLLRAVFAKTSDSDLDDHEPHTLGDTVDSIAGLVLPRYAALLPGCKDGGAEQRRDGVNRLITFLYQQYKHASQTVARDIGIRSG